MRAGRTNSAPIDSYITASKILYLVMIAETELSANENCGPYVLRVEFDLSLMLKYSNNYVRKP